MFPGPLGVSLAGEALLREIWSLATFDIRSHGLGRHRAVDDTPAGGGPGMVIDLGKGLYVAYLEEIEERMPATYPNEPIAPPTMFDGDTFRKSGPRFSARIPFYEERATSEG